jgi:predicted phosphodiesterase
MWARGDRVRPHALWARRRNRVRIGILTDIHGDIDTMRRVLDLLATLSIDRIVCLGDLVVHGRAHNEVVDFFRTHPEIVVIKGNHDIGATVDEAELEKLHFFSPDSRANTLAAREALTTENKAYLAALPLELQDGPVCYTHATIGNPFAILRNPERLAEAFKQLPSPIMIAGHTHRTRVHHLPAGKKIWCSDNPAETGNRVFVLDPADRYIINVGCTAQLKFDAFPPICAVFEPGQLRLEFHELVDQRREIAQALSPAP